jgi:hypothetical protein
MGSLIEQQAIADSLHPYDVISRPIDISNMQGGVLWFISYDLKNKKHLLFMQDLTQ